MKYYYLPLIALGLQLTSCDTKTEPTAAERRAAFEQQQEEQLANEQRTLRATDSLLQVLAPRINEVTQKMFDYEKTEYDDLGHFRPKGTDPADNLNRTYLRSAVDDYGRTQLIGQYSGAKNFCVVQLQLEGGDGTTLATRTLPRDTGTNYSYDIDGNHYQAITFIHAGHVTEGMTQDSTVLANADTDNGALAYIAQHCEDTKLTCYMIAADGRRKQVTISERDRLNLAATYELGTLLREMVRLQQDNRTASLKIEYLQQRNQQKAE